MVHEVPRELPAVAREVAERARGVRARLLVAWGNDNNSQVAIANAGGIPQLVVLRAASESGISDSVLSLLL